MAFVMSSKAKTISICLSFSLSGILNGCLRRSEIHFLALLKDLRFGTEDFVLSHFANLEIRLVLGVTTSTVQGSMVQPFLVGLLDFHSDRCVNDQIVVTNSQITHWKGLFPSFEQTQLFAKLKSQVTHVKGFSFHEQFQYFNDKIVDTDFTLEMFFLP